MPELNPRLAESVLDLLPFLRRRTEVVRFTVGQPDFDTPAPIVAEAKAALDRGETAYTRPQGLNPCAPPFRPTSRSLTFTSIPKMWWSPLDANKHCSTE